MRKTPDRERSEQGIVSSHDRETVARALATAAGQGRLSTEELQMRLARAHQARTYGDLEELSADLPAAQEPEERTVAEHVVPETLQITAALRKARRNGQWKVPRRIVASAGRGDVELDFTEAQFNDDNAVTVDARPNLANIEILVPEGYRVSVEEAAPGVEPIHNYTTAQARPDAPFIHLLCRPGMGSIIVRHPRAPRRFFRR